MSITYKDVKRFNAKELEELFLSVEWSSGHYPEKLVMAMQNSGAVFSAWDEGRLVGLVNALDDGVMTAYLHYLLVNPQYHGQGIGKELLRMIKEKYRDYLRIVLIAYSQEKGFYEQCGFNEAKESVPMLITSLWT